MLNLSYDHPSGLYLNESTVTAFDPQDLFGIVGNIGYAHRISTGVSLDGGVTQSEYFNRYGARKTAEYTEGYFGFFAHNVSSHIYYSPDYYGHGVSALYGEVEGFLEPIKTWRLSAHAGYLDYLAWPRSAPPRGQYDWRLSASHPIGHFDIHAAVSGGGPDPDYYDHEPHSKTRLTVGASWTF